MARLFLCSALDSGGGRATMRVYKENPEDRR